MNLLTYLIGLVLVSFLAGACLTAILIFFNPFSSSIFIFILFYASLFISSASIFTLIGWIIRVISKKRKYPLPKKEAFRRFEVSFRQGIFLAIILVVALIFQSMEILFWWSLLALVVIIGLSEWLLSKR